MATENACRQCGADRLTARYRVVRLNGGRRSVKPSTTGCLCRTCAVKTANGINQELRRQRPSWHTEAVSSETAYGRTVGYPFALKVF